MNIVRLKVQSLSMISHGSPEFHVLDESRFVDDVVGGRFVG